MKHSISFEQKWEERWRKIPILIPLITLFTGAALYFLLILCAYYFNSGYHWTVIPAGLVAHAFFIVIVHDGAHQSITRSPFDRILLNLGSALMFLPFYGEGFRKYHLMHHGNTNSTEDPLWPPHKKKLYQERRWLYVLCELIPLLFTFYLLVQSSKANSKKEKQIKGPTINYNHLIWAFAVSGILFYFLPLSLYFFLGTLFFVNVFSTLRHWCEHLGRDLNRESNTFWFPLGMGIGNHEVHHQAAHLSWFSLFIGLFRRKKDTSVLGTVSGVFFQKDFHHYEQK